MIQFLIFGAVALGTGAILGSFADGVSKKEEAEKILKATKERYCAKEAAVKRTIDKTQKLADEYFDRQTQIKQHTVERFAGLMKELRQKLSIADLESKLFQELEEILSQEFAAYHKSVAQGTSSDEVIGGVLLSSGAGVVIGEALGGLLLGGAAGGAVIGLALMGLQLAAEGEKALTEATEYAAKVEAEVKKMDAYMDYLENGVQRRIQELNTTVQFLDFRCQVVLDELETAIQQGFNAQQDAEKLQRAALLFKALIEIIRTALFDRNGNMNPEHTRLLAAYRSELGNI